MVQVADARNIRPQAQPNYHMLYITQAADNSVGLSEGYSKGACSGAELAYPGKHQGGGMWHDFLLCHFDFNLVSHLLVYVPP